MTCLTSALQPPQPVAALVQLFTAPISPAPATTAAQISALLTLWHEQICALSGSAATPSPFAGAPLLTGRISVSGSAGSAMPFSIICSSVAYSLLSPTSTPPSSVLPSAETTIFL